MASADFATNMLNKLKRLHDDGKESDFTFVVGAREFKVHKLVLHLHSSILYNIATKNGNKAELKGVDPDHAAAMIKFMYHQTYEEPALYTAVKRLENAIAMNAVAHKFAVTDLVAETETRFHDIKLYYFGDRTAKDLAEIVDKAYSNLHISPKMRDLVMQKVCEHIGALAGKDKDPLTGTLLRKPKLAVDLIRFMEYQKAEARTEGDLGQHRERRLFKHCSTILAVSTKAPEDGSVQSSILSCPDCSEQRNLAAWEAFEVK